MLSAANRCLRKGFKPAISLTLYFALFSYHAASAQTDAAPIQGSVVDATGAAIPGAAITVTNRDTNAVVTATSDPSGNFAIPALVRGNYEANVSDTGFSSQVQDFTLRCNPAPRPRL